MLKLLHSPRSRWLIVAPALLATVWSFVSPVSADPLPGLATTYYVIDDVPPVMSDTEYPLCGSEVENNINRSYDGEPYLDCTNDLFMVHMTGFITIPEHDTIQFWLASDDGGTINIDGNEWGSWNDQGCSATESGQIDIVAGSQPLDLWMYENGGGTCLMLAWNIDDTGWSIVPDGAFTTDYLQTPTTTIPDTTIPDTTIAETTTTWTTSTTTTSTIAESTTVPATNPSTTSTLQTISTYPPEPTMPEPPATVPPPPTTMPTPPETQPEPPDTLPAVLEPLLPFIPDTMPEPPDTMPELPATIPTIPLPPDTMPPPPDTQPLPPDTAPEAPQAPETSEPAKDAELPPITDEAVVEALADIEQATPAEVKAIVTELLTHALTTDQAVSVASEPAVLAVLTNEEAAQVFEQVTVEELTTEQAVELVAAVQDAPTKVRKAFEAVLNLFQGFADDYVMTNQTVPIKTRRALIALGAVFLVSAPAPTRRNRR
jgi:hypothetical protein